MKILSIEDSSTTSSLIRETLQSLEFEVLSEETANAGMETLKEYNQSISLILLDWNLPDKKGIDLLKEMKSDDSLKKIPVMMVSGKNDQISVLNAIRFGALNYLIKPFTNDELAIKVKQCLNL